MQAPRRSSWQASLAPPPLLSPIGSHLDSFSEVALEFCPPLKSHPSLSAHLTALIRSCLNYLVFLISSPFLQPTHHILCTVPAPGGHGVRGLQAVSRGAGAGAAAWPQGRAGSRRVPHGGSLLGTRVPSLDLGQGVGSSQGKPSASGGGRRCINMPPSPPGTPLQPQRS